MGNCKLRRSLTIYPRIVVDQVAYETFLADVRLHKDDHSTEEEAEYVDRLLRTDTDGARFIDYLAAGEGEFDHLGGYMEFLDSHAMLVREKLGATNGRVREKFEWLAAYHNSVVEQIVVEFENGFRSISAFRDEFECDPLPLFETLIVES